MSFALAFIAIAGIQAQDNKTIEEESTIERVVTKSGSEVKVMEVKSTKTVSGAVIVEGNNQINQQEVNENVSEESTNKVLVNEVKTDAQNDAMIKVNKKEQQAELKASEKEQAEIAAKKKMELGKEEAVRLQETADRKAKLEARPKGTAKLRKEKE